MLLRSCQFKPLSDAAMLEAAILLAEYIEKSCSVNKKKKRFNYKILIFLTFGNQKNERKVEEELYSWNFSNLSLGRETAFFPKTCNALFMTL